MNKILIIGATGTLALPVIKAFLREKYEVTAMVRDIEKAKSILPHETNIVQGDLKNTESIKRAIEGINYVYLNLGATPTEKEKDFHPVYDGLENVINVAKENDIKRIGMISSLVQYYEDTLWWVFGIKKKAVSLLRDSGVPNFIFYPSSFMESIIFKYRQGNKIMMVGKSHYPAYWIAGDDYGNQVVNAFKLNPSSNREYVSQGKKGYTIDEAVDIFINNYTKEKLKISTISLGFMQFMGLFSSKMNYSANICRALNNYEEKFGSKETWRELGEPKITLEEFAASI